jgi:ATP-dependent DNA helicase 2 subunit 1
MAPFESWSKIEDDEEELEDDSWWQGRQDAVLFAIDCSESMLELRDDGKGNQKSHLLIALEGCRDLQRRKATVSPNDSVGILIFNIVCSRFVLLALRDRAECWTIGAKS